jgi:hypothetical protein
VGEDGTEPFTDRPHVRTWHEEEDLHDGAVQRSEQPLRTENSEQPGRVGPEIVEPEWRDALIGASGSQTPE